MKKITILIVSLMTLICLFCNSVFALEVYTLTFLENLLSIESWDDSQVLSYDEIKYKNDPEFKIPPELDFDKPVARISNQIDINFLEVKSKGEDINVKFTFTSVAFPEDSSSSTNITGGVRNKYAAYDLILGEEKKVIDGAFKKCSFDDNWELYINGSQLGKDKYWVLTNIIIFDEEVHLSNIIGKNSKVCSSGKNALNIDSAVTYYRTEDYQIFENKAESFAEIKSDKYDVESGIPTGENLTTTVWVDNADYYIKVRTTTYKAEVKDLTIRAEVSYSWGQKEGKTWKQQGSDTATSEVVNYSIGTEPILFYDVPISTTAILTGGTVMASDGVYALGRTDINAANIMGEAASKINFKENFVPYTKEIIIEESLSTKYTSKNQAQKAAKSRADELVQSKIIEIEQTIVGGLRGDQGSVDFDFYGLRVNKDGISRYSRCSVEQKLQM